MHTKLLLIDSYFFLTVINMHLTVWKNNIQFALKWIVEDFLLPNMFTLSPIVFVFIFAHIMEVSGYCQLLGY